jgi:hypothetical protein
VGKDMVDLVCDFFNGLLSMPSYARERLGEIIGLVVLFCFILYWYFYL